MLWTNTICEHVTSHSQISHHRNLSCLLRDMYFSDTEYNWRLQSGFVNVFTKYLFILDILVLQGEILCTFRLNIPILIGNYIFNWPNIYPPNISLFLQSKEYLFAYIYFRLMCKLLSCLWLHVSQPSSSSCLFFHTSSTIH